MLGPNNQENWLEKFLTEVSSFVTEVGKYPDLIYADFRERVERANAELVQKVAERRGQILSQWEELSRDSVDGAGLDEQSRSLKLFGFYTWLRKFRELGNRSVRVQGGRWTHGFVIKKVLEWAKIILGSLSKLVPGAEFVSEGLEAFGASLKARGPGPHRADTGRHPPS